MLTLYHYDRSTAAQRVRLSLEEKQLEWESVIIDTAIGDASQRPDDYHKLNPKGLIPLIIHGDFALPESNLILEYLEDAFPMHNPLRPQSPKDRAVMRLWMRRIEDGIHVASRTIGVCIVNRHIYNQADKQKLADYYANMRDTVRKNNDQINIQMGLGSPLLKDSLHAFKKLFYEMDVQLKENTWLAGQVFSLADVSLAVYLTRLSSFQMSPLWADLTHLRAWFESIEQRVSYQKAVIDWGDITAEKRKTEGLAAFETVKFLWNSPD
ncbi:MAG: glutathione S-transferase family protein [Paracoccaceae bacterium]|jgi:glutathione S-transferase